MIGIITKRRYLNILNCSDIVRAVKTSFFIRCCLILPAAFLASYSVGPLVGFGLGAACLSVYVNLKGENTMTFFIACT